MNLRVRYFASLREHAGTAEEEVGTIAATPAALYAERRAHHGFVLPVERVSAAVNGAFAAPGQALRDGDEVAFLPPVAGG